MSDMPIDRTTITKEELGELEAEELPVPVTILDASCSDEEIESVMDALSRASVLGLDTETKPSFHKGEGNKVSILQLSDHERSVIIKLLTFDGKEDKASRLAPVARVLADDKTLLVGVSIHDDALGLRKDHGLECHQVLELQLTAKAAGLKVFSLSKLYALLYDKRISKSQRLSNWESEELSEAQTNYAALDAYAGLLIYDGLKDFVKPSMIEKKVGPTVRKPKSKRKEPSARVVRKRRVKAKPRSTKARNKTTDK